MTVVCLRHLQFDDDTLIMGEKSWANIKAIKSIILLFELTYELNINFHKNLLVGINVNDSWLEEAVAVLHSRVIDTHFNYFCMFIKNNSRHLTF